MDFSTLVEVCGRLEETSSRLDMASIVADFLKGVSEDELPRVLLFLRGKVFSSWSDREIGIGSKLVLKAISNVSGVPEKEVEKKIKETGDPGLAAESVLANKAQTTLFSEKLTLDKVYGNLERLAGLEGKGSQDKKIAYIAELLSFAEPAEAKYIVRLILEELRLGVGEGIVRDAIARAFDVDPKLVERAHSLCSDLGEVAKAAKNEGSAGVGRIEMRTGRPVEVMLAQKIGGVKEAVEKLGKAAFEVKYDGARIQLHKKGKKVELYTRRLENVTRQFPEVVEAAEKQVKADDAILEGELVAIASERDRRPRPFQDLSRRIKRKYNISRISKDIPVELNLFDVISLGGENLAEKRFEERRKLLEGIVGPTDSFRLADQLITDDAVEAEAFYRKALDAGHEGVMAKNLDAPYQPGSRVGYMYKIKPIMETLDLAVVGATWGEGRRASWLGSYLLAVYDSERGEFLTIGRMATGFSDEQLQEMTDLLREDVVEESGKEVVLRPNVVFEVAYEEIQKSPTYTSGYALRFPRFVRIRSDKGPEDADTPERVSALLKGDTA